MNKESRITKNKYGLLGVILTTYFLLPTSTYAHCPLCTAGAGALAVFAASIGVATATVGVFIGAFALALGLWIAPMVKRKFVAQQDFLLALVIFLSTIIPIMPLIREYRPLYIALTGEYGTLFHNTYTVNLYLLGATIGAILLFASPSISKAVTKARGGKILPYQGLGITFILLIIAGVILQIVT